MDTIDTLITLGISLGLGLLVGLQRERKGEELAGIRTFALITLWGTIAAIVGKQLNAAGWLVAAGAVGVAVLMAVGAQIKARANLKEIGLTTEIAALVMYGIGAYLAAGDRTAAVVLGGAVVLLLYWKNFLHGFVHRMGDRDIAAIMQFVLIALVIWPILPNTKYGPYGFFNPFETWLVVILVVSISLLGYVLYKLMPPAVGTVLAGAIGGLVSSTATTVSYARRSRAEPQSSPLAAQAIMLATLVSVLRVIVLVALFTQAIAADAGPSAARAGSVSSAAATAATGQSEPSTAPSQISAAWQMIPPLAVLAGTMAILSGLSFWFSRREPAEIPEQQNPTELGSAIVFAVIYTAVRLATAWGKETFGASALYAVGGIAGLTDVDAITVSMSDFAKHNAGSVGVAWRVLIVAILANLVCKAGIVWLMGSPRLKKWVTLLFAGAFAAGLAIIFFWTR